MELPKYNQSSRTGEDGITILKRIVEKELGWIFRVNHKEHDFGIDAYIDIVTDIGQVTGKTIALQIKTGDSYFKEKDNTGWIYRGELSHLNYYLNHDIAVVIILLNEKDEKAYWCYCDPSKTSRTGENWKIIVPFEQVINEHAKPDLLKYVSATKDYVSQLEHFWSVNKELAECGSLNLVVDKADILKLTNFDIKNVFERLQVNNELVTKMREKVDIWIHGYNEDSRELYEIPEIKEWIFKAFEDISGWTYFLAKERYSSFLKILQLCKMKITPIKGSEYLQDGLKRKKIEIDFASGAPFLRDLFDDLNSFCDKHKISDEINIEITDNLMKYLKR